jgi:hypothetical protein
MFERMTGRASEGIEFGTDELPTEQKDLSKLLPVWTSARIKDTPSNEMNKLFKRLSSRSVEAKKILQLAKWCSRQCC